MKKTAIYTLAVAFAFVATASITFAAKPLSTCQTIKGGLLQDVKGNPITLGYDKYGYNYEAHMFNGLYDNYSRPSEPATSGDRLMMKWNDAWLSNKSCDGDQKLDRHYGLPSYIGSGAWLTNHASGSYEKAWNLDGNWTLGFNSTKWPSGNPYMHTLSISGSSATGASTGNTYDATISITGNSVTITANYLPGSAVYPYTYTAVGDISSTGTISGTWTDTIGDSGTWNSTSGMATKETCEWSDFVKIVAVPTDATEGGGYWYSADGTEIGPSIWGEFAIIQEISSDPCGNPDLGLLNYKSQLRAGLGNW